MCAWVIAMNKYAEVYKDIEPKIKKRDSAETELKQVLWVLKKKQNELAEVESKIQMLKDDLDKKQKEMQDIQDRYDLNSVRLNRAGRLTSALSDEEVRWREIVEELNRELLAVPGDVLVASACVAYLGAFSIEYRRRLSAEWIIECQLLKIPSSTNFSLIHCLGEPYQIQEWNMTHGLPRDEISIENGIIVTQSLLNRRWPLMIDPQQQANRWIRNIEKDNKLIVTKQSDPNLMRLLEMAIRQGMPLLLEELGESIDPSLQTILAAKLIFATGGRILMRFGDADIDYNTNFKLFMTTKLMNPHYLPEVCIQVTLVNFLVTFSGLEDQLLADVIRIELPEMEKQRGNLIVSINNDKQQLLELEDKILKLLFSSRCKNILDDEELVDTLNESKETSIAVVARLVEAEKTEEMITLEREKYRALAAKGAVLFFVVSSLSEIDPMYQFSLSYFSSVFCSVIEDENHKKSENVENRLKFLIAQETYAIFTNVSRGLFESHKLIFSFQLATAIEKHEGRLSQVEVDFLLHGLTNSKAEMRLKPSKLVNFSEKQWKSCLDLEHKFDMFRELSSSLTDQNETIIELEDFRQSINLTTSHPWNETLSPFKKLMLISVLKPELLVIAIKSYVHKTLGTEFTKSKETTLSAVFQNMTPSTPLIFVLSPGSDPMRALQKFAQEKEFTAKLHSFSLGQGQGPAVESLLSKGRLMGHWVFLQNCHLATSWLPQMEAIVRSMELSELKVHPDFRMFMSSMSAKNFPVSVLQSSVKLISEPPQGLRTNLLRSLTDGSLEEEHFEMHILRDKWRKLVFGICMFHGVVLERRKFGSLGFNNRYEFNESDRECALRTLDMFVDREKRKAIPWQALEYINGEITYGGRVTDHWDQRCLKTILKNFSSQKILADGYAYSESGSYKCPNGQKLEDFKDFVEQLPYQESPEIFGLHQNANIIYRTHETEFFLNTLRMTNTGSFTPADNDEVVLEMIAQVKELLIKNISIENIESSLIEVDGKGRHAPLTTVLLQEVQRFNILLKIVHNNLIDVEKAIRGFAVMSEHLEEICNAFLLNKLPTAWSQNDGFLSTKSLACWIKDFSMRIEFIDSWVRFGLPRSIWISGLFYPQSFLTGSLQTYARKHNMPIDFLRFDYEVLKPTLNQQEIYELRKGGASENSDLYEGLAFPQDGIIVHGLYIEAGKWNTAKGGLCDPELGELSPRLPALWLKPCKEVQIGNRYEAPLYKTPVRAGVTSSNGYSTNFVHTVLLETNKSSDFWVLRGTALVTLVTE